MRILLDRPVSPYERFGLGPFFSARSPGLEYPSTELLARGHEATTVDLRLFPPLFPVLRMFRPEFVGVCCTHAVDRAAVLADATIVRGLDPSILTVVGGDPASVFPQPSDGSDVDAVCTSEGDAALAELVAALSAQTAARGVAGWRWVSSAFPRTRSVRQRRKNAPLSPFALWLGRQRFFESFESWRRNVLGACRSKPRRWRCLLGLSPSQMLSLARVLIRTQWLLDVDAKIRETFPQQLPALPRKLDSDRHAAE